MVQKRQPYKIDNQISASTARLRLCDIRLPGSIASKVPLLRKKNWQKRKKFVQTHKSWCRLEGIKKCDNILSNDETNIRRPKEKKFDQRYTKKKKS